MRNTILVAATASLLASATAIEAGKRLTICRDQAGNPYFTDVGCPLGTSNEGRSYVSNAQSYWSGKPGPSIGSATRTSAGGAPSTSPTHDFGGIGGRQSGTISAPHRGRSCNAR